MPKPVLATDQDLKDAVAKLTSEIQRVQSLIEPAAAAVNTALTPKINAVDQKVTAAQQQAVADTQKCQNDAKHYTNESCKALHTQILPLFGPIEAQIASEATRLGNDLGVVDANLKQSIAVDLMNLTNKFDDVMKDMKAELKTEMLNWATQAAEEVKKQRNEIDAKCDVLLKKMENDDTRVKNDSLQALKDALDEQNKKDVDQDAKFQRACGEIYVKIGIIEEKLQASVEKLDAESKEMHHTHVGDYSAFLNRTEQHFVELDDSCDALRNAMSEVENVSTRRVDWVIKDVSKRIRPLTPSKSMLHTSWFSPKFDAAGAHGLQLELQLFRNSDPAVDGQDAGDVAIHLWACKGMNLCYKLSCGSKTAPMIEKTFNGRVPFGTKRFWFISNEINKEDDTLKVSVEILEAVREVEHLIKPPALPVDDPDAPPKTLEEIHLENQIKEKALDGSLFFQRACNNRLYDQVKQQVDVMQSRMVRKIEWKVESASLLRRCFAVNECLCSVAFSAAGIEGMQFVYYPSGYKNATEGYCSLFLYGPAGATLKCWLSAGNQKREASHSFDEPGAFGRTNFCRFESCVDDAEDCITIVLDIEDAQQDWAAQIKHPTLKPGDKRSVQQIDGSSDKPIESIVKLTKKPGTRASGKDANLIELKVLPSLWTAKQIGMTESRPMGMQTFDDIRASAKGPAGAGAGRQRSQFSVGSSLMQNSSMVQASSSMPTMPTLRDVSMRTAIEEDLSPPLPQLARSSEGRDFVSVRKSAGQRPRQKLGASMTAM